MLNRIVPLGVLASALLLQGCLPKMAPVEQTQEVAELVIPKTSDAEIDLMIEKARVEERSRAAKEYEKQKQQAEVFQALRAKTPLSTNLKDNPYLADRIAPKQPSTVPIAMAPDIVAPTAKLSQIPQEPEKVVDIPAPPKIITPKPITSPSPSSAQVTPAKDDSIAGSEPVVIAPINPPVIKDREVPAPVITPNPAPAQSLIAKAPTSSLSPPVMPAIKPSVSIAELMNLRPIARPLTDAQLKQIDQRTPLRVVANCSEKLSVPKGASRNEPYRIVEQQVIVRPATTKKVQVPAKYKVIEQTVIEQGIEKQIKKQVLVEAAKVEEVYVPAVLKTVKRRIKVDGTQKGTALAYKQGAVVCYKDLNPVLVARIQQELAARGYLKPKPPFDMSVVDGVWGPNTALTLDRFNKEQGLPFGGVTLEGLRQLGVIN